MRPAQRPLASGDAYIAIQERGRTLRVPLAEVLYFKAELKYVTVRTAEREYILTASLGDLEARYSQQFLRIHRNALVARQALRSVQKQPDAHDDGSEAWTVGLNGCAERLAVSRRQVATVREAIAGG